MEQPPSKAKDSGSNAFAETSYEKNRGGVQNIQAICGGTTEPFARQIAANGQHFTHAGLAC